MSKVFIALVILIVCTLPAIGGYPAGTRQSPHQLHKAVILDVFNYLVYQFLQLSI
jgi:hypothetical protein